MDVYFERIAGVADTRPQPPTSAAAELPGSEHEQLDDDGFPLSPLRDQDHLWFLQASEMHRPLSGAAAIARASGLSLMLTGGIIVLLGGLALATGGSPISIVFGAIMLSLGTIERSGAQAMAAANPRAPRMLARNQLILLGLIVVSAWTSGAGSDLGTWITQLVTDGSVPDHLRTQMTAVASILARGLVVPALAVGVTINGSLAAYYLSQRRAIGLFHRELPPWVAQIVTTLNGAT